MNDGKMTRTLGRDSGCDIVLDEPGISDIHARLELEENGLVSVIDAGSTDGVFLKRNQRWIKIRKITLCTGDKVSFGQLEVSLGQLTAAFGEHVNVRLGQQQLLSGHGQTSSNSVGKSSSQNPFMQKPRRNPLTGKIEEDRSTRRGGTGQTQGDKQI